MSGSFGEFIMLSLAKIVLDLLCLYFQNKLMGGKWYLFAFATNTERFVTRLKADLKMATAIMVPTEDGDFDLSYSHLK